MKNALTLLVLLGMGIGCSAPPVNLTPGTDPNAVAAQIASTGSNGQTASTPPEVNSPSERLAPWCPEPKPAPSVKTTIENGTKVAQAIITTTEVVVGVTLIAAVVIIALVAKGRSQSGTDI